MNKWLPLELAVIPDSAKGMCVYILYIITIAISVKKGFGDEVTMHFNIEYRLHGYCHFLHDLTPPINKSVYLE